MSLLKAIEENNTSFACSIVDKLQDMNYQNESHHTALHSAVEYNNLDVAIRLLDRGANIMLMPKNQTCVNKYECPMLMAMMIGASHEAMQILLLRAVRHTLKDNIFDENSPWTEYEHNKIALLPHYALLWCTSQVFSAAIEHDGNANSRSGDDMTPFMTTLRNVICFETDLAICQDKMTRLSEDLKRHPEMLWDRYSSNLVRCDLPFFCNPEQGTALVWLFSVFCPHAATALPWIGRDCLLEIQVLFN